MGNLAKLSFSMSEKDFFKLKQIQRHHNFKSRSATLRFIIRQHKKGINNEV